MTDYHCRFCAQPLHLEFCDLGMSPVAHRLLPQAQLEQGEHFYPLRAVVCEGCWLVQLAAPFLRDAWFEPSAAGNAFALNTNDAMRAQAQALITRFSLTGSSRVIEIGSGGGARLRPYLDRGVQAVGIEADARDAHAAIFTGVTTRLRGFGSALADELVSEGLQADLLLSNDRIARAADLNDEVSALRRLLKPEGALVIEVPYLLRLLWDNQFDALHHERLSYFSVLTAEQVLRAHGLVIFDVEEPPGRGAFLRLYVCHDSAIAHARGAAVDPLRQVELDAGLNTAAPYAAFAPQVIESRMRLLEFLFESRRAGQRVWGYGAPGSASTLLNYCGIRRDLLECAVESDSRKQGCFFPGVRIPVVPLAQLASGRPDVVLVLARHHLGEVQAALSATLRAWGGRLAVAVPEFRLLG